mmetsp:Transcript_2580/g.5539  ORF Transcript_2580/g.5539 Transcript_2580/m.5539 type:complete len:108 (+) Transcript_2580:430-753(+)
MEKKIGLILLDVLINQRLSNLFFDQLKCATLAGAVRGKETSLQQELQAEIVPHEGKCMSERTKEEKAGSVGYKEPIDKSINKLFAVKFALRSVIHVGDYLPHKCEAC